MPLALRESINQNTGKNNFFATLVHKINRELIEINPKPFTKMIMKTTGSSMIQIENSNKIDQEH